MNEDAPQRGLESLWQSGLLGQISLMAVLAAVVLWAGLGVRIATLKIHLPAFWNALQKSIAGGNLDRAIKLTRAAGESLVGPHAQRTLDAAARAVANPRAIDAAPTDYREAAATPLTPRMAARDCAQTAVAKIRRRLTVLQVPAACTAAAGLVLSLLAAAIGRDMDTAARVAAGCVAGVAAAVIARETYVFLKMLRETRRFFAQIEELVATPEFAASVVQSSEYRSDSKR